MWLNYLDIFTYGLFEPVWNRQVTHKLNELEDLEGAVILWVLTQAPSIYKHINEIKWQIKNI